MAIAWFVIGAFYLCLLTWQDLMHKRMVDERHNYFMTGLSIGLIYLFPKPFWYLLAVIVISILLQIYMHKLLKGFIGTVDMHSIGWIIFGLSIINYWHTIIFVVILCVCSLLFLLLKKVMIVTTKRVFNLGAWLQQKSPFYPIITISFILLWIGYYIL